MKADLAPVKARYQLTLLTYPNTFTMEEACQLLYQRKEKNLIAAMSSVPYAVGRTFDKEESLYLHQKFSSLEIEHSFTTNDPTSQPLSFVKKSAREDAIKPGLDIQNKRPLLRLKIYSLLIGSCLLAYLLLKYLNPLLSPELELRSISQKSSVERFSNHSGLLVNIRDRVEYRSHDQLNWQTIVQDLGVDKGDSVRTFSESSADILYRDGSKVGVRPNSLVVVGSGDADRFVSLQDGDLHARLRPDGALKIDTPAGLIELKKSSEATRVDTSIRGKKIEVAVRSGKATLIPVGNQPPIDIMEKQKLTAIPNETPKVENYTPSFLLLSPASNAQIEINPSAENNIIFTWENLGDSAKYWFEIYSSPTSTEPLLIRETTAPKIELKFLDLGTLSWKVKAQIENEKSESEFRIIHVKKRID